MNQRQQLQANARAVGLDVISESDSNRTHVTYRFYAESGGHHLHPVVDFNTPIGVAHGLGNARTWLSGYTACFNRIKVLENKNS